MPDDDATRLERAGDSDDGDHQPSGQSPNPPSDPPVTGVSARRPRAVWVHVLIVLAAALLFVTSVNVWLKRQMLDTDNWVAVTDDLLADEQVRAALSAYLVDELYTAVDVSARLEERLPGPFAGLAGPVAAGLRAPATELVDRLLATRGAQEVWSRANRRAHETFLAVVRDETGPATSTAGGVVTLELREIVIALGERIGLPRGALERIPDGVGTIVLVESDRLDQLQRTVRLIEWASIALFLLIVAMFVAAVVLARGWRRIAISRVGLSVVIVSLIVLVVQRFARSYLLENFVRVAANRPAISNAWWIATQLLRDIAWTGVLVGSLMMLGALLAGPARQAVAVRRRIGPTLVSNPAVTWGAVAVAFLGFAMWTPFDVVRSWGSLLTVLGVVIGVVVALRSVCAGELGELTATGADGSSI